MGIVINALYNAVFDTKPPVEAPSVHFYAESPFRLGLKDWEAQYEIYSPAWNGKLFYSYDSYTWAEWDGNPTEITSSVYLTGTRNTKVTAYNGCFSFLKPYELAKFDGFVYCEGDLGSLLDCRKVANGTMVEAPERAFSYAFHLENLVTSPTVNFQKVGLSSFANAFSGTKIKIPPALPATILSESSYIQMFSQSLVEQLPKLPAQNIPNRAYYHMFSNTNIKLSVSQTGEYQYPFRVPDSGTGVFGEDSLKYMVFRTQGTYKGDANGTIQGNTTYYTDKPLVE